MTSSIKAIACLGTFYTLLTASCYGKTISYSKEPLELNVSRDFNRIGFAYSKIQSIVGNKNKCEFIPLSSGELSFFPKAKFGERLEFGFITNTGVAQDVVLTVKDIQPQNFMIDIPLPHNILAIPTESNVDDFLAKVLQGRVQFNPVNGIWQKFDNFKLKNIGFLTQGGFIANVYEVLNMSNKKIILSQDSFKLFFRNASVYIDQSINELFPRGKVQMVVVSKI